MLSCLFDSRYMGVLFVCILLNRRTIISPIYIYVLGMDCMSREGEYEEVVEESDEDASDSGGEDASDSGEDDGGLPGAGVQIELGDLGSHVRTDPSSVKGLLSRLALLNARWD